MDFLESILLDPSAVTFTALFVGLFVYVMKKNEQREEHYRVMNEALTKQLEDCRQKRVRK